MFILENVHYHAKKTPILEQISCTLPEKKVIGFIGPNGSGKSTLLKIIAGFIAPSRGNIQIDGQANRHYTRKQMAQKMAFVQQQKEASTNVLVRDIIRLGRTPWLSLFDTWRDSDDAAIDNAIALMDLQHLQHRYWDSLSGGEQQRVSIAQGLAQETPCLILDEPTNHLDIKHQIDIINWIREQSGQRTLIVALHDLNQAIHCCDQVLVLKKGTQQAYGEPSEILTPELIQEVFHVNVRLMSDAESDQSFINYYPW